nr:glycosyltransferase family 4 protein [Mangrovimonas futianensis]
MIAVIPPAINTSFFNQEPSKKEDYNPLSILTVARLHWIKGLEYTLEALALLKQAGLSFRYSIVGEGDQYARLVWAVHQLGLKEEVTFLGKQNQEQIKEAYQTHQVYLQYSIQEGFCNAVLEAQAMGLMCIVSDADGLKENVLDGETGWVVPKRQPHLLTKQLLDVVHMPKDIHDRIRNQAVIRIQKEFYLKRQQAAFVAFFNAKPVN